MSKASKNIFLFDMLDKDSDIHLFRKQEVLRALGKVFQMHFRGKSSNVENWRINMVG